MLQKNSKRCESIKVNYLILDSKDYVEECKSLNHRMIVNGPFNKALNIGKNSYKMEEINLGGKIILAYVRQDDC